jgi:UDPglucose 6-dehydrogenase
MRISVIGLGKLGAVMAAVLADKGFQVAGVDTSQDAVDAVNEGRPPVEEPGLAEMIARNRERLSATTDFQEAVRATEATFIIVPTPSEADGRFSLRNVLTSAEAIGGALRQKTGYHLVVLSSTVMPGSTGGPVLERLERFSGRRCGPDFGLCYSPEFIALGSVIRDMLNPDIVLIGESDERAGAMVEQIHRRVIDNEPHIRRMNFVNAEITKLSVNTFVTTKISYANMLAEICDRLAGADVDVVTGALGLDSRIGRKYLTGALGYGGPCFPRDNRAFARLAEDLGVDATLARATDAVNCRQAARLGGLMLALLPQGGTAGILGLSYKPDTNVVDESQGLLLAEYLLAQGVAVMVYDPAAMSNARQKLDRRARFAASMEECAAEADVIAITTAWDEFRRLKPEHLNHRAGRPAVIDCWRILRREIFEPVVDYVTLGQKRSAQVSRTSTGD